MRLSETGVTDKGRELVMAGKSFSTAKAWTGFGLSFLPGGVRGKAFDALRKVKG